MKRIDYILIFFMTLNFTSLIAFNNITYAGGIALYPKGTKGLGNMYAGGAAIANDASTIYWNPAGMTILENSEVEIGFFGINPTIKFSNSGSNNNLPDILGGPTAIQGGNGGNAGDPSFIGNLFLSQKLNESFSIGLGIFSPFGLSTKYNENFVGRYYALNSELTTLDINPSAAYRINKNFSVGVGVSAFYADAKLSNAIDFGLLRSLPPILDRTAQPSTGSQDGKATMQGDGWGYGWNTGLMYEFDKNTRFGISYRSKLSTQIKGDTKYTIPSDQASQAIADALSLNNSDSKANIDFPATASLSGYHRFGNWGIMGDITWTQWSSLDEIKIKFSNNANDNVTTLKWNDTLEYSVGLEWYYNNNWTFRSGIKFDKTPIPNAKYRSPRIPDDDHLNFAIGASYNFNDNWKVDFGGSWIYFLGDSKIDKSSTTDPNNENFARGGLNGKYDIYGYILGIQINYIF